LVTRRISATAPGGSATKFNTRAETTPVELPIHSGQRRSVAHPGGETLVDDPLPGCGQVLLGRVDADDAAGLLGGQDRVR
jgi:hypothetical protein